MANRGLCTAPMVTFLFSLDTLRHTTCEQRGMQQTCTRTFLTYGRHTPAVMGAWKALRQSLAQPLHSTVLGRNTYTRHALMQVSPALLPFFYCMAKFIVLE